jgi:hypothetical protein
MAKNSDPIKENEQSCESTVYLAAFVSLQGEDWRAVKLYRNGLDNCPAGFIERRAAQAALRSMGEKP